ncbi:16S rRNA (guanine(966)-N(2))-methyltransferase RsmD [Putridiphycobacter roseus]|uniref:16S rRNA (Guanine(966)-N(2))-methyltransferase RsmD n=1 Tax=Putridiphycobacter roseus TaxID=2219161 RepID=A0A2W1NIH6_9FLAO|nr:16S rRNA (guanine(966)-N(2))-methyltransferase RsmD [Putridiphycobacter roseus]PZE17726.1 16S rRNA (guanine(966)-N(2))-methyltransferase RsmD [Putridiphycobacter roseus]
MRVIGGKYKSRRFSPPKNFPSRPTTDFAKESLFNILDNRIEMEGIDVLDCFAGTGNISLEFLSRGANSVLSVDSNFVAFKFIKKTQAEIKEPNWQMVKQDVFKYVPKITKTFDLIFADPPFALKDILKLPSLFLESGCLKDAGDLIIEHGKETDFSKHPNFREIRNYGGVNFSFFTLA